MKLTFLVTHSEIEARSHLIAPAVGWRVGLRRARFALAVAAQRKN